MLRFANLKFFLRKQTFSSLFFTKILIKYIPNIQKAELLVFETLTIVFYIEKSNFKK